MSVPRGGIMPPRRTDGKPRFAAFAPYMLRVRSRLISGNTMTATSTTSSTPSMGRTSRLMAPRLHPLTLLATNRFGPTGGVTKAMARFRVMITPK